MHNSEAYVCCGDRLLESVNMVKHENMKIVEILGSVIWRVYMEI